MKGSLESDDIARITQAVVQRLGGKRVDEGVLRQAVRSAAASQIEERAPSPPKAAQPAPAPAPESTGERNRVIVASFGLNRPGIVAAISQILAENLCSIEDMSQRIMQEFYTLIMIVDITSCKSDFAALNLKLKTVEEKLGVTILAQHEDVFRYMHRV